MDFQRRHGWHWRFVWRSLGSIAFGVSGDGSVIVGEGRPATGGTEAFIWDSVNGMQNISDVLTSNGVDMTGWLLDSAHGISDDGMTIVGRGINSDRNPEAWVANLSTEPVPEPATIALLGIGLVGIALTVRSKRLKSN